MKKALFLILCLLFPLLTVAQINKTLYVPTAGTLGTLLTENEKATINNLTLTGVIDDRDFKTMRDQMDALTVLDISGSTIVAYTGTEGTYSSETKNYPGNEIPAWAFHYSNNTGKASLTSVLLPSTITAIGESAFDGCTGMHIGGLPSSLTAIRYAAFYNCRSMTTLALPASVTTIEEQAFAACGFWINVNANNPNYSSINGVLFNKNQSELLYYPGSIAGGFAVPSTVKTIGNLAFYWCNKLTSVTIPSSTTYIGYSAFEGCDALTFVSLPSSLDSIGATAFYYCMNLININIPASVKVIGSQAFLGCSGPFTVDAGNPNYSTADGLLYNKTKSKLIQCPISKTGTVAIASSVTNIEFYAFIGCACEVTVDGNHLNYSSGEGILFNKVKSRLLYFPTSKVGSYTVPASVTYLGSWSFYDCQQLTSVIIPSTVTNLGYGVFKQCFGLTSVYSGASTPIDVSFANYYYNNIFSGVNKETCTLHVPTGSKSLYQQADQWKDFANIVEISTGIALLSVEEVCLWPNPANNYFSVKGLDGLAILTIFDVNGKLLLEKRVSIDENISISSLPKGLYLIRIASKRGTIERKLIKK